MRSRWPGANDLGMRPVWAVPRRWLSRNVGNSTIFPAPHPKGDCSTAML